MLRKSVTHIVLVLHARLLIGVQREDIRIAYIQIQRAELYIARLEVQSRSDSHGSQHETRVVVTIASGRCASWPPSVQRSKERGTSVAAGREEALGVQ